MERLFVIDQRTYAALLRECTDSKCLSRGKQVHAHMSKRGLDRTDTFLGNLVVQMYGKCGSVEDACEAFHMIDIPNIVSWTFLITGYAQNGHIDEASRLFAQVTHPDVLLFTAMITAFVENGRLDDARKLFTTMPERNFVSWNAMISGYAQQGLDKEALHALKAMDLEGFCPNSVTLLSILSVCTSLEQGKLIHANIYDQKLEIKVGNALISMYGRLNNLDEAMSVFESIPVHIRDVVSWTAMISACFQNDQAEQAMQTFARMDLEGVSPNRVTFVSILNCCSTALDVRLLHLDVVAAGFQAHTNINNALVTAYARSGSGQTSWRIFRLMPERDTVSFNSMIMAYAQRGYIQLALELSWIMDVQGISRNHITFTSILYAFGHAGLLEKSRDSLLSMQGDFHLELVLEHCLCLMELLGKAGKLEEAEDLIHSMPFEPDKVAWNTLLGACGVHKDSDRGARATESYVELSPRTTAPYVLLSNLQSTTTTGLIN